MSTSLSSHLLPLTPFLPQKPYKSLGLGLKWRASASSAAPGVDLTTLEAAITKKDGDAVKEALDQLSQAGWAKKWSSQPYVSRRTTTMRELTTIGIKNAENLAIPSVRNDAAFLFTVVGTTGFLGLLAGQLPGDWGFFVPYLLGSISLVVLAIGSISPGLLQAAIGAFSTIFPDYQERIARHEAAHFLVAYLLGLPILEYSLDIGKEHVNLVNERLQKLIYSGQLDAKELDRLAVVSMAGLAAEGLMYEKVVGQSADLFSLQVSHSERVLCPPARDTLGDPRDDERSGRTFGYCICPSKVIIACIPKCDPWGCTQYPFGYPSKVQHTCISTVIIMVFNYSL